MAYGIYSEVYFAVASFNETHIKIGETENARRRANQLSYNESYNITQVLDVPGGKVERLLVESYLRARIKKCGRVQHYGNDHFTCDSSEVANWIAAQFPDWVAEAVRMLDLMDCGGTAFFNFGPSKRPIPPQGQEYWFKRICESLEKTEHYECHFQCGYDEEFTKCKMLNDSFAPFGYSCTTSRNCSWVYFTIKKS